MEGAGTGRERQWEGERLGGRLGGGARLGEGARQGEGGGWELPPQLLAPTLQCLSAPSSQSLLQSLLSRVYP